MNEFLLSDCLAIYSHIQITNTGFGNKIEQYFACKNINPMI